MIDYLSNSLHQKFHYNKEMKLDLPLYLKASYQFMSVTVSNITFLLVIPKSEVTLSILRKHHEQIEQLSKMKCAFVFSQLRSYKLEKMIEYGIPFVCKDKYIYLPFLAIVFSESNKEIRRKREKLMPKTQETLLSAIYEKWNCLSASEIAKKLTTSRSNATRIFDEIESLQLDLISLKKNTRYFVWGGSSEELWDLVKGFLHSPVKKSYNVDQVLYSKQNLGLRLSGFSALSKYTLLADSINVTIAISKSAELRMRELVLKEQVHEDKEDAIELQCYEYWINYGLDMAVDPLSAFLSLNEEEQNDPRVRMALDEIWKGIINDKWNRKI